MLVEPRQSRQKRLHTRALLPEVTVQYMCRLLLAGLTNLFPATTHQGSPRTLILHGSILVLRFLRDFSRRNTNTKVDLTPFTLHRCVCAHIFPAGVSAEKAESSTEERAREMLRSPIGGGSSAFAGTGRVLAANRREL